MIPKYPILFWIVTLYIFWHATFAIVRFWQVSHSNEYEPTEIVFGVPMVFGLSVSATAHLITVFRGQEIANFVTRFLQHERHLTGT